jgi:biopolymer transport protein ExbB
MGQEAGRGSPAPAEETMGEETGGQAAAEEAHISYLEVIKEHSGIPGWIIIGMSVIAFYLAMQNLWHLRRPNFVPEGFVEELNEDLRSGRLGQMMQKCRDSGTVLAHVIAAGLSEVRAGYDEMVEIADEVTEVETSRLHQRVGWLALIGAIAPMLGLTGTVLGMMGAFGTISQMETQPPPRLLAGHIQHALVTTCEGLIVAVPVLVAYAIFRNRVNTLMHEVRAASGEVLSRFRNVKVTTTKTQAGAQPTTAEEAQMPEGEEDLLEAPEELAPEGEEAIEGEVEIPEALEEEEEAAEGEEEMPEAPEEPATEEEQAVEDEEETKDEI